MAEKNDKPAKPFRWTGPGILSIRPDALTHVVVASAGPKSIVRDSKLLAYLGAAKVDGYIKDGHAEYLNLAENVLHIVEKAPEGLDEDVKSAAELLDEHALATATIKESAKAAADRDAKANAQASPGTLAPQSAKAEGVDDGQGAGPRA